MVSPLLGPLCFQGPRQSVNADKLFVVQESVSMPAAFSAFSG